MTLFDELQDLMVENHFRPEKKLSQFFCINEALLYFITKKINLKKGDVVLEVGPGTGFFTKILLSEAKKVGARIVAVELGENMFELLSQKFSEEIKNKELELIFGDVLEVDLEKLGVNKIASLPPYHISSALVTKIILTSNLTRAILVLDRGFVDKIIAFEGFTEYGALTAMVNLNSKTIVVEDNIAPQSFFPAPNCQSAILQMDFDYKNNSKEYFIFLKEIFRHKNKDLQKALKQSIEFLSKSISWSESEVNLKIVSLKNAQKKVYLLSPKELLEVFNYLDSN
ncbi:MAG: rRNA adenine N-6-methyltransferase family protein [Candidatus ainarchaeum sp.]|jgi:16S rRNA (adenine1518-N6/adenine1519-N6)-dimethyltransferase|nr:rRNA adenine N-6-methyltransferase family protein [Candidatus ainarchaeum sp.]MDD3086272.1 rRNA adenine N-6-methyltransferase family protein [Candidatus ainarchaeum sp.]MDD4468093.1 rRNA adenine N-6-methyltransferase family protein [Candidatus ainarchaeum sp.]HPM85951.1 rRNA adenine N-6-methyltransferase family protein [archaeon]